VYDRGAPVRILLVEDQQQAAKMLAKGLREHSYTVDIAATGHEAVHQASNVQYDAILLDVILPGKDGIAVCGELRQRGLATPILMLTARDAVDARIAGLDSGADDYVVKPFEFRELLARLRAVIRRGQRPVAQSGVRVGVLELDMRRRQVTRLGKTLSLTAREYALLEYLMLHAGHVVRRSDILEYAWDGASEGISNVIDVFVQRLRRKIDVPGASSLIVTRRREGYVLVSAPEQRQSS
jgi:DNA-binding response OmpR family regulator